jgi:phosphoribosylformylglycinamidine synthase
VVGTFDDVALHLKQYFKSPHDVVLIVRSAPPSLAASEYAALFGAARRELAPIDLVRERKLIDGLVECADRRLIRSAHDVSEGGLAVTLAESCFNPDGLLGVEVDLGGGSDVSEVLFGEGPSTVVISAPAENIEVLHQVFGPLEVVAIGHVTLAPRCRIGAVLDEDVITLQRLYEEGLSGRLDRS